MLNHKKWLAFIVLLPSIFLFIEAGTAQSQSSANYMLKKDVADMSGAPSRSANYSLIDAIAQSGGIGTTGSSNYRESSGFFSEGGVSVNPTLSVSPTTLDFGTTDVSKTFQISNSGGGMLTWAVTENPDKPWITSITPVSGSNNATVAVIVDRHQLSENSDTGTLVVTSNGGSQNVTVKISKATSGNLFVNGDFSSGDSNWWLYVHDAASATGAVESGEYHVSINNGGSEDWHIQLGQSDLSIENGKQYNVSFDAYATSPREISPYLKRGGNGPWLGYHDYQPFSLTTTKQTYSYSFVMNEATDNEAIFYIDIGNSTDDVYFDNMTITGGGGSEGVTIYPNASNTQTIGNEFWVDIVLGNSENPVSNLFGVSFDLEFTHTTYIDVVVPTSSNVIPGDFIGSDVVFIQSVDEPGGKVSIGISRKQGQGGVDGFGTVARIKFTSNEGTPDGTQIVFSLSNIEANDPNGASIELISSILNATFNSGVIVWPGDTNNDGAVNQADILPLGLFWGSSGPSRPDASNVWIGQAASAWSPENATYADASGDGIVNQADILPIGLNWGKTHNLLFAPENGVDTQKSGKPNASTLRINLVGDTQPSGVCWVEFLAEDITDLFGISFEMVYSPTTYIDSINVESGSWLGNDIIFYPTVDMINGKVSFGISRKAGQGGISGSGVIATLRMRMKDIPPVETDLTLQNVIANDPQGSPIQFEVVNYTITEVDDINTKVVPRSFELRQNYPNPFNPETTIEFSLPYPAEVMLTIYDLSGHEVRKLLHEIKNAGYFSAQWDARDNQGQIAASGVYFYRIEIKAPDMSFVDVKKMILMK